MPLESDSDDYCGQSARPNKRNEIVKAMIERHGYVNSEIDDKEFELEDLL